jgi:hypothetical protein
MATDAKLSFLLHIANAAETTRVTRDFFSDAMPSPVAPLNLARGNLRQLSPFDEEFVERLPSGRAVFFRQVCELVAAPIAELDAAVPSFPIPATGTSMRLVGAGPP